MFGLPRVPGVPQKLAATLAYTLLAQPRGVSKSPSGSVYVTGLFDTYAKKLIPPSKPIGSSEMNLPILGS